MRVTVDATVVGSIRFANETKRGIEFRHLTRTLAWGGKWGIEVL